jgi:radical SAM superfamily enzyme YgiQ (UPF0313 family)
LSLPLVRQTMKLLLISSSHFNSKGVIVKTKKLQYPCLTLPYLAGLTPNDVKVKIVSDYTDEINFDNDFDLVGITFMYMQAERAFQIGDEFRKRGKTVIMGGMGASMLLEETLQHSDSVVIAEAELVWKILIDDFKKGKLNKFYRSEKLSDLQDLPEPRFDLLNLNKYRLSYAHFPVGATRGCPYNCSFCSVTRFYGHSLRLRPIDGVIRDIKAIKSLGMGKIQFVDDNLTADKEYALKLFESLIPLRIIWGGQCNINIGDEPELLKLAAKSGCKSLFIGIETIDQRNLKDVNKGINKVNLYEKLLSNIRKSGIICEASLIVGFDNDDTSTFKEILNFLIRNKIPILFLYILTPFVGTRLYEELEKEGRIVDKNWSKYDGTNVVYSPKLISAKELESGYWQTLQKFYSIRSILRRLSFQFIKNKHNTLIQNII